MAILMTALFAAQTLAVPAVPAAAATIAAPEVMPAAATSMAVTSTPALTDEMIRKAVRETVAEDPRPINDVASGGGRLSAITPHDRLSAAFEQAKVPDCLHQDALKQQPATIGPINVVGPYSLPWVIAAAVRGKCR